MFGTQAASAAEAKRKVVRRPSYATKREPASGWHLMVQSTITAAVSSAIQDEPLQKDQETKRAAKRGGGAGGGGEPRRHNLAGWY